MGDRLPGSLRRWGATLVVVAYAFAVLAPTVAFARADHASIVHVLSESHGGMLILHFHDDDGDRHEHPVKSGSGPVHHCCGVISLPGLEPSLIISIQPPQATTVLLPSSEPSRSGCGSSRLERPPRPLPTA
jgi:hypothetical protein